MKGRRLLATLFLLGGLTLPISPVALRLHPGDAFVHWDELVCPAGVVHELTLALLRERSPWAKLGGRMSDLYLTSLGHTIAGGTAEILRTTVAVRGLGLPALRG